MPREHIVSWTDASGLLRIVSTVIHIPGLGWRYSTWQVPLNVLKVYLARHNDTIGVMEALGLVITLATFGHRLRGCFWTSYCDNDGDTGMFTNGLSTFKAAQNQ